MKIAEAFSLQGRVAVITGGAGLLGPRHAEAVAEAGGVPVLVDILADRVERAAASSQQALGVPVFAEVADITNAAAVAELRDRILAKHGQVDILINNAANNPTIDLDAGKAWSRLENFPLETWQRDLDVGLTGALLCAQAFGTVMARRGRGVILNIASDLALIAPDQRIYRRPGLPDDLQPAKPVSYCVVKSALLGLTRYLGTYWAAQGVRTNALCPGGVDAGGMPADFRQQLTNLIPLGRMAGVGEYKGAVLFLISDASAFMTGAILTVDGGRTAW